MAIRRNILAILLTIGGCILLGLAALDWMDYIWTIVYHADVR